MYSQYNMNLSVIENPDVVGVGCNLNLFSFYLGGKRTYWGAAIIRITRCSLCEAHVIP